MCRFVEPDLCADELPSVPSRYEVLKPPRCGSVFTVTAGIRRPNHINCHWALAQLAPDDWK